MPNRYTKIVETIFHNHHRSGSTEVVFARDEFAQVALALGVALPKNLGDVIYSFRYRVTLPESIQATAPAGKTWVIRSIGRSQYVFVLVRDQPIAPNAMLAETKIPDGTPGIVSMYALGDEQALLAKVRYNRLIDVFTGLTCYSLQNHLRTTVEGIGQVETDELYVGLDKRGAHYVIPVQAKGGRDRLAVIQIEQDIAVCREKFAGLICRPIGVQFIDQEAIALFEFELSAEGVVINSEKHYRLTPPEGITENDLLKYQGRTEN